MMMADGDGGGGDGDIDNDMVMMFRCTCRVGGGSNVCTYIIYVRGCMCSTHVHIQHQFRDIIRVRSL